MSAGVPPGTCPGRFTFHPLGAGDWKLAFNLLCLSATDWLFLFPSGHSRTSLVHLCHGFAAESSIHIRVEILSISCSASGIINKLGLSTNLSSELRSSLSSQRLLIYLLLSGVWKPTSWPSHISAASSREFFLLVHFLFIFWLKSHRRLELWIVSCGGKAAWPLTLQLFLVCCAGLSGGDEQPPRWEGPIYYSPLFPGRREKHPPSCFGFAGAIR